MLSLLPEERRLYFDDYLREEAGHGGHSGDAHVHSSHQHGEPGGDHFPAPEKAASSAVDPHFWTDPLAVRSMLPELARTLGELDPAGAEHYRSQADLFARELDKLHEEMTVRLKPVEGQPTLLFHPSFLYLIRRYRLQFAGVIEAFPGKSPTPRYLAEIIETIESSGARAIFTEPQLARQPARVVAESADVALFELDPIGGQEGRMTYRELMLHNADVLREALQ
jgi:ABC-type Zn uptake system ZnuABC Zn-binding protein ZnuA